MAKAAQEATSGVRNVTRGDSEGLKTAPEVTKEGKKTTLKTALCPWT